MESAAKLPGWNLTNLFWISAIHILAVVAILFFFSWSALWVTLVGVFVISPLGINIGYHRMLTHKGFSTPQWFRYFLVTLGTISGAGPPLHWAAMHRVHHRFSDTGRDPHDSSKGFWYSHVLHLFSHDAQQSDQDNLTAYAPDLLKEPYLVFLNDYGTWLAAATLPLLFLAGGWSWLFWGGFLRVALTWNIMWFVNSATHVWGYRNYDSRDRSTNCWWVGLLAAGEGWHNNHHAQPACAVHGHRWWELDLSYFYIRTLALFGLVWDIKLPAKPGAELHV